VMSDGNRHKRRCSSGRVTHAGGKHSSGGEAEVSWILCVSLTVHTTYAVVGMPMEERFDKQREVGFPQNLF
jgi:hypothetical protein